MAGLSNPAIAAQFHAMASAKNLTGFETALQRMQLPMFNIIYADKTGNIMYLFNGNVPVRNEGDWTFWQGAIDGTNSKHIWTKTHPYRDSTSPLPSLAKNPGLRCHSVTATRANRVINITGITGNACPIRSFGKPCWRSQRFWINWRSRKKYGLI